MEGPLVGIPGPSRLVRAVAAGRERLYGPIIPPNHQQASDADLRAVALARYQDIVDAPDFGDLDYESVDLKATKPTKGAIRVNDLLETITGREHMAQN